MNDSDRALKKQAALRQRKPLTDPQRNLIDFYRTFHERTGYWPTFAEVVDGLKFNSNEAVAGHVRRLLAKGYMTRGPKGKQRSIAVVPDPGDDCCPTCGRMFELRKRSRGVRQ